MVAELRLIDPRLELAVGGVLELGVLEVNHIFGSSHPIPIEGGAGLFSYESKNSLSYFARYQFILSAQNFDDVQIRLVSFWVMLSYCREIVGIFACS